MGIYFHGSGCPIETDPRRDHPFLSAMKASGIPVIQFSGVNTEAHYKSDPTKIATKIEHKNPWQKFKDILKFEHYNPSAASVAAFAPSAAPIVSVATGIGVGFISARAMSALSRLKKENPELFPETIFIGGYSRGAITSIKLSNAIQRELDDSSPKLHLFLDDPVPGPSRSSYVDEKKIPSNVASVTSFYSICEQSALLTPTDNSTLSFDNEDTIVSSYGMPTTHTQMYVPLQSPGVIAEGGYEWHQSHQEDFARKFWAINNTKKTICQEIIETASGISNQVNTNVSYETIQSVIPTQPEWAVGIKGSNRAHKKFHELSPLNPETNLEKLIASQRTQMGNYQLVDTLQPLLAKVEKVAYGASSSSSFFPPQNVEEQKCSDALAKLLKDVIRGEAHEGKGLTEQEIAICRTHPKIKAMITEWEHNSGFPFDTLLDKAEKLYDDTSEFTFN